MPRTVSAFIAALQRIPATDLATIAKEFRRVCRRQNYKVVWVQYGVNMRFWAIVVTPGKRKLFVKRFRPISIFSERKKLNVLISCAEVIGLPKIYGITDDWVIYEYIARAYSNCIKRRRHLFETVDHLLNIHKMPTGARFVQHSFFRTKVATVRWGPFVRRIPKIAKIIRRYGAPAAASEQLLMLSDRITYEEKGGWTFAFPAPAVDAFEKYDFALCHGGYVPKHLFRTPQGLRVIDWETATLFSRWYDVWRLSSSVSADLTDVLWSRYIRGYLAR